MKVKELKKILENKDDDGVIEIEIPVAIGYKAYMQDDPTWWESEVVNYEGLNTIDHLVLRPTEIVMI